MSYTINKTDGSILATVADGQVDQLSSDITLIGKNYSGFGESLNENFVKMLENFADTAEPERPIRGQIWFDVSELKLKVYNGTQFQPVSSATISNIQPSTLGTGDLWFNDTDKQLFFYDGTNTILLGPSYSQSQGLSGLKVASILDSLNQTRVITYLYTNGVLLGIFSKDSFTPKVAISGYSGDISPGFNAGTLTNLKFNVTATNADKLGNQPASKYLRQDTDNIIDGQLTITSNRGVLVGDAQQGQFVVVDGDVEIRNDAENKNISVKVKRGAAVDSVLAIDTISQTLNIYKDNPGSETFIGGNLVVAGDFTIQGDTTTINTSTINVEDKNIELAKTDTPTDSYADGGGIILKGASDHEFLWTQASTAWNSTEHINLATGKAFKINGVEVITATSLGPGITSIPGVTSFGTQTLLTVGPELPPGSGNPPTPYLRFEDNRISTVQTNQDLEIAPDGTGNISLINYPRITGLNDPVDQQDAATKEYVDNSLETRSLVFSMDISDAISNSGIAAYLTLVAPPADFRNGTVARILCTSLSNGSSSLNINTYLNSLPTTEFITPDAPSSLVPGGTAFGVTGVSFATATVPAPVVSVFRIVKTFQLVAGTWTFVS